MLTLRVGISGHRPKDSTFPASSVGFVEKRLAEALREIETTLGEIKGESKDFYAKNTNGDVSHGARLVSGLAEGADQMAIKARPPGWAIDAILPFPKAEYLLDFEKSARDGRDVTNDFLKAYGQSATKAELPRDPLLPHAIPADAKGQEKYWQIRSQAYARLGRFLLSQIDILVAVWDGRREEGAGGTAEVVRGAVNAGIPVLWVSTFEDVPARLVHETGGDARPITEATGKPRTLRDALSTIVAVPASSPEPGHGHRHPSAQQRLRDFFGESWPAPTRSVSYDLFKRWKEGKTLRWKIEPPTLENAKAQLEPFLKATPDTALELRERIRDTIAPRYAWADQLAIERSNWYRSAYINCYLLAALLVLIALLGVFVHDIFDHNDAAMLAAKAALVFVELALIYRIFRTVKRGRRDRWQERWVEYRALAEMFRSLPFLAYVGEHGYIQRSHDLEPASSAWFLWYLRATIREIGLPSAVLDEPYQKQLLKAVEDHVIDSDWGQLEYNEGAAKTLSRMHHALHIFGDYCFIVTAFVLGAFFFAYAVYIGGEVLSGKNLFELIGVHAAHTQHETRLDRLGDVLHSLKSFVTLLAALLPALGAAVFGIRETGDFEGFSKRAARTAEKLKEVKRDFEKSRNKLALESTDATLLATAQILSEDVGAWQSVYGRKQLSLPG